MPCRYFSFRATMDIKVKNGQKPMTKKSDWFPIWWWYKYLQFSGKRIYINWRTINRSQFQKMLVSCLFFAVVLYVHAPISVWFLSFQQIVQHEWIGLSVLGRVEVKYKKGGNGVPAPQWGQQKPDYLPSKNGAGSARNKLRFWVTRPVLPEGLDGTIWALKVEARRIRRFSMDLHLNLHMK